MATRNGTIKKTALDNFANPRKAGINAANLPDDDELIEAAITDGTFEIILATRLGQAIRFPEEKIRAMGRSAYGVRGINLAKGDYVIGMVVVKRDASLLTVTENGYGKRTSIADYRVTNRGGKGVINIKANERNGKVVTIKEVLGRRRTDPDNQKRNHQSSGRESDTRHQPQHTGRPPDKPRQRRQSHRRRTSGERGVGEDNLLIDIA